MNRGILKKSVALVMTAAMVFSMAGCGKKDGGSSSKNEKKEDTKEMVFAGTDLALEGVKGDIGTFSVQGDKIYFNTYEWIEKEGSKGDSEEGEKEDSSEEDSSEDNGTTEEDSSEDEQTTEEGTTKESSEEESTEEDSSEESTTEDSGEGEESTEEGSEEEVEVDGTSVTRMYSMNLDGSDIKEIPLPELSENEYINYNLVGKDNTFTLVLGSWDEKTEKNSYAVQKLDADGKEIFKEDVTDLLKLGQESWMSKVLLDDKGRLIFITDQNVIVLDETCTKVICEIKSDNYIEGGAKTKDGKIVCGASDENGSKVQVLDIENKKWGESIKLDLRYFQSSDSLMDGSEYDFYYKDNSGIYGYDIAGKKSTKVMDYVASDINSDSAYNIIPIAKDQMLGTTWMEEGSKFVLYNKVDPSTIKDKKTITFGAMWMDDNIKRAAIDFNKTNQEYRIEFKDYSNEEDPETKMNADIIAGNVPDIISLDNIPINQYVAKGLLEDLTPYMEKDSEVKSDALIPSVAEAMKTNDKFYFVSPGFGISTLIARTKDVGDKSGWTFDEMKALLEEKGDSARPFYSENKSEMLYSFLNTGINDFIDWTTGECSFDGQDFKSILEICNKGKNEETEYNEDSPSMPTLIKEGKVLFSDGWIDVESVEMYEKMFGEDITFIGYPNKDKQGSYFNFNSTMGIYSKSDVKEGAWEFIRSFMTKEYQGKQVGNGMMNGNPTRQDAFDMMMKAKTTTEKYTDEFGQEIQPLDSSWGWDDLEVKIVPLTDKEAQMYKDLINNTKKSGGYNNALMEIITEEAKAYFAGEKSLDETADIIQNRIKTYVNENR